MSLSSAAPRRSLKPLLSHWQHESIPLSSGFTVFRVYVVDVSGQWCLGPLLELALFHPSYNHRLLLRPEPGAGSPFWVCHICHTCDISNDQQGATPLIFRNQVSESGKCSIKSWLHSELGECQTLVLGSIIHNPLSDVMVGFDLVVILKVFQMSSFI